MRDPLPRVQRGLAAALRDPRTQLSAAAFVLTALACYLYVLVGNINNYDNIVCTPEGYGTGLRSGRWMLTLLGDTVGHAMGNFNLPLFNGLLGLVFLGLACQFLWRALHLQKPWQCAVLTAITAAWPAAASAMLFSFTVHYYLFAVLLAAVAVWMADRSGWGWLVGAALTLACSIGVYQAYFPLAAALLVLRLLQQCLTVTLPLFMDNFQQFLKANHPPSGALRKIRSGKEGLLIRRHKDAGRPATAAGKCLTKSHIDAVYVWTLFLVHLDGNKIPVQNLSRFLILKALMRHHMAPVTGAVADAEKQRFVFLLGLTEGFLTPWIPVYWIICMLNEIGTGFMLQSVGHYDHILLSSVAGLSMSVPSSAKREPWQGQSQECSALLYLSAQPM